MKKLAIIIILFLCFNTIVFAQSSECNTPECYDNAEKVCECNEWTIWEERDIVLTAAPDFPNCSLIVSYCFRQCLDRPECVELYIKDIRPTVPYCGECDLFWATFNTNDEWINARVLARIFTNFWRQIVYIKWEEFLNGLDPSEYPYCDDPNTPRLKIFAYMAKCVAYCKTQQPIGIDAEWLVQPKECIDDFCCIKWIELCVDRTTGETVSNEYYETNPNVDCNGQRLDLTNCHPGFNITVTDCIDNCSNN